MTWTRQRLFGIATLIFLGQLGAILALHTKAPVLAKLPPFGASAHQKPGTNSILRKIEYLDDPLVFAGAHPAGFSGSAWLRVARLDFDLSNSVPPPVFLPFEEVPATQSSEIRTPAPSMPLPLLSFDFPESTNHESQLTVEGPLTTRTLLTNPSIPIQFSSDVLSNSIVQIGVQSDGFPLLVRLISGSGSRSADLSALEIANRIRFAPSPLAAAVNSGEDSIDSLQWGRLVFQWFTAEATATNNAARSPK